VLREQAEHMDAPDRGPHCRKVLAPRRSSTHGPTTTTSSHSYVGAEVVHDITSPTFIPSPSVYEANPRRRCGHFASACGLCIGSWRERHGKSYADHRRHLGNLHEKIGQILTALQALQNGRPPSGRASPKFNRFRKPGSSRIRPGYCRPVVQALDRKADRIRCSTRRFG